MGGEPHSLYVYDFLTRHWGDVASVLGLAVSLVGFSVTIVATRRSKRAAIQAKEAAEEARDKIRSFDLVSELTEAIAAMEEIKRLLRSGASGPVPDRCAVLKKLLIGIRSAPDRVTPGQKDILTASIQQFSTLEKKVDQAIERGQPISGISRMNQTVSGQIDTLTELLETIRQSIGK
jgi:uncharacterized protein (UPF0333 family)